MPQADQLGPHLRVNLLHAGAEALDLEDLKITRDETQRRHQSTPAHARAARRPASDRRRVQAMSRDNIEAPADWPAIPSRRASLARFQTPRRRSGDAAYAASQLRPSNGTIS